MGTFEKIENENVNIFFEEESNFIQKIVSDITNKLSHQLDDVIIQGLALKGYKFDDKIKLMDFIKENCKVCDEKQNQRKIYLVKNIPFLMNDYSTKEDILWKFQTNKDITVECVFGKFYFV